MFIFIEVQFRHLFIYLLMSSVDPTCTVSTGLTATVIQHVLDTPCWLMAIPGDNLRGSFVLE